MCLLCAHSCIRPYRGWPEAEASYSRQVSMGLGPKRDLFGLSITGLSRAANRRRHAGLRRCGRGIWLCGRQPARRLAQIALAHDPVRCGCTVRCLNVSTRLVSALFRLTQLAMRDVKSPGREPFARQADRTWPLWSHRERVCCGGCGSVEHQQLRSTASITHAQLQPSLGSPLH